MFIHPVIFAAFVLCSGNTVQKDSMFVAENGASVSFRNDVIEVRESRGWLRTPRVYLDFRLSFEFQAQAKTDAAVMMRTWFEGELPRRGYRLQLPMNSEQDPASLFVGRNEKVVASETGSINLRPLNEWQSLEVVAQGRRIAVTLNGTSVGTFQVETFGGQVLIEVRRGLLKLRNITMVRSEVHETVPAIPMAKLEKERIGSTERGAGVSVPELIYDPRPSYTREAMERGKQGRVSMKVVVMPDGSVGPVRVVRSLDPDLDLSAVATVKAWRFKPGILDGKAVPVLVEVEMTFTFR